MVDRGRHESTARDRNDREGDTARVSFMLGALALLTMTLQSCRPTGPSLIATGDAI